MMDVVQTIAGSWTPRSSDSEADPLTQLVRRALGKYSWVCELQLSHHRTDLKPTTAPHHLRRQVDEGPRGPTRWVQVGWVGSDPLRSEAVQLALDWVEAQLQVGRLENERSVLWGRFDQLQRRLKDRNEMTALGTMAAGVVHDIRSPLTVLVTNFSVLEDSVNQGPVDAEELREVLRDNRLALELIEGVLDSMRAFTEEGHHAEVVRVETVIKTAARFTRFHSAKHQVRLKIDVDSEGWIRGPRGELTQVLLNLLSNAAQASPTQSSVWVVGRVVGERVVVWVVDEGKGVPPDQAELIFEPFHTSKANGTGLGLSLAREVARRNGGELRLAAADACGLTPMPTGACFELSLPLAKTPQNRRERQSPDARTQS